MSTSVTVSPRRDGDPVADILGMELAHRVMLRDLDRTTALIEGVAAGREAVDRKRAHAIAGYLDDLGESIHHHHHAEDDILWPVIEASAGAHVDLTELTDDHEVLVPKLERLAAGAAALRDGTDGIRSAATALAVDLADLRDTLHEHIGDEERTVFPVIRQYVSAGDWDAVEARIRKNGAKVSFEAPRVLAVATPEELGRITAELPAPLRFLFLTLMPRPFRKRERLVFGG